MGALVAIVRKRNAQRVIRWGKSNSEGLALPAREWLTFRKGWGFSYQRKPGPSSAAGEIVLKCWVWGRQVGLYGLRDVSAVDTTASKLRLPVPASTLNLQRQEVSRRPENPGGSLAPSRPTAGRGSGVETEFSHQGQGR